MHSSPLLLSTTSATNFGLTFHFMRIHFKMTFGKVCNGINFESTRFMFFWGRVDLTQTRNPIFFFQFEGPGSGGCWRGTRLCFSDLAIKLTVSLPFVVSIVRTTSEFLCTTWRAPATGKFIPDIMPPTCGHSAYITCGALHLHADNLPTSDQCHPSRQ